MEFNRLQHPRRPSGSAAGRPLVEPTAGRCSPGWTPARYLCAVPPRSGLRGFRRRGQLPDCRGLR